MTTEAAADAAPTIHPDDDPRWREVLGRPGVRERLARHATSREIAFELSGLREAAGLGVRELARRAGWDPAFVTRVEAGRGAVPTPATVLRYARACGAEAGYAFKAAGGREAAVPFGDDILVEATDRPAAGAAAPRPRAPASVARLAIRAAAKG